MKLTVLGNNGPYPKAGGACSGYLIEANGAKILIDCGNGVLSRFLKDYNIEDLDAIILTHLHSDHISDILVMKYALGINKMKGKLDISIPLYCPTDDEVMVNKLNYNDAFKIIPIKENMELNIKELKIDFKRMNHPIETYGVRIKYNSKIFVYSSDTAYHEELIEFAKGSDLFLCEAGLLERDRKDNSPHLSVKQAVEIGNKANVKKLVLTHFWPEYTNEEIISEAKAKENTIVELSQEMKTYLI